MFIHPVYNSLHLLTPNPQSMLALSLILISNSEVGISSILHTRNLKLRVKQLDQSPSTVNEIVEHQTKVGLTPKLVLFSLHVLPDYLEFNGLIAGLKNLR